MSQLPTVVHTIAEVRKAVAQARRAALQVGFVPTMGALHEGHASLIRQASTECDYVVVSIFVNPLQFGPSEDFERYPRTMPADVTLAGDMGADLIFAPSVQEMYPEPQLTFVEVEQITGGLCGASRPGHFKGVSTVVTKLFNIVLPDAAYFGQKDAQQAAVIKRMVKDLSMPLEIRVCPTVRESDGLAKSSRNVYLTADQRAAAPVLYQALQQAEQAIQAGERDAAIIQESMARLIEEQPLAQIDYCVVVDADSLAPVSYIENDVLLAVAVYFGKTRLIDNVPVKV